MRPVLLDGRDTVSPLVTDAVMQVRDLDFYYGKFQGLKKVTMDLARNKVTAFIGPSGCGKSTLLRTFNRMFDLYPGQRAEGSLSGVGRGAHVSVPAGCSCTGSAVSRFRNTQ